jgi:four helix bundle protein
MVDARDWRMGVRHVRELITWQLADAFETEVLRLVRESPEAFRNLKYRGQIEDAVGGIPAQIAEGFARRSPRDFCRFLDYALASLAETEQWLSTGIKRGYFEPSSCEPAFLLARRTLTAAVRLKLSQLRYLDERCSGTGSLRGRTRRPRRP